MKKTLSVLALVGVLSLVASQSAEAFSWSNLNPFSWGKCHKCEKQIPDCNCPTGYATPCNPPCKTSIPAKPCDECDRLQQEMAK